MTEFVPKVLVLEEFGFKDVYLIPSDLPFARDSLELIGISPDRVVEYRLDGMVADRFTFTEALTGEALAGRPELVRRLRAAYLGRYEAPPPTRRLYLARHGVRQVVNESELMALLAPYGFTRVYMDDHPLEEQIWLASNAEILLGPHGAATVFALFMPPNGLVVELFSPNYVSPAMIGLSGLMGTITTWSRPTSPPNPTSTARTSSPFSIRSPSFSSAGRIAGRAGCPMRAASAISGP